MAVRPYNAWTDRKAIIDLIVEHEGFYGEPTPPRIQVENNMDNLPPGDEFLVAESGKQIVGFLSFATQYPGYLTAPMLYVKEIFVSPKFHRQSHGRDLMQAALNIAVERGCKRVEWTTAESNKNAQAFYEKLGAHRMPKIVYRFEGDDLIAVVKRLEKN